MNMKDIDRAIDAVYTARNERDAEKYVEEARRIAELVECDRVAVYERVRAAHMHATGRIRRDAGGVRW